LDTEDVKKPNIDATNFRLPITYLDSADLRPLSPVVAEDLELFVPGSDASMYDRLFRPTSQFGKSMIPAWTQQYTTNTTFLEDTQLLISKMKQISLTESACFPQYDLDHAKYVPNYETFQTIWRDLKEDSFFLEKYGYMEWSMLAHFNENSSFLQCLSVVNVVSPLISLFLPVLFIILPFIILKIQRIPINFTVYLEVLQSVAKNHFIGKALIGISSLTWDKAIYLAMTAGLYFLQIYQNISICHRFYRNMIQMNQHLVDLREFVHHSIQQMDVVLDITEKLGTYRKFNEDVALHLNQLKNIQFELSLVRPFEHSVSKFGESGYMLRCFYRLHTVVEYDMALRYASGFEGYLDNLRGIYENLAQGHVSMAAFVADASGCVLVDQCYPALVGEENVALNTVDLSKNIILSGPNRSGKTTLLKSTALNIIFSQQVGCGFYASAALCPYTHIHSYLNIPDTSGRDSLFQAESRRCKDILDHINEAKGVQGSRHFCIFDELYSGTNPEEATKAGYAFLKYLTQYDNVNFMLTTHYIQICKKFCKSDRVENYMMYVRKLGKEGFDTTFKMKRGISKVKGAVQVLKDLEYPAEIIESMQGIQV
jgi:hypothetical protein